MCGMLKELFSEYSLHLKAFHRNTEVDLIPVTALSHLPVPQNHTWTHNQQIGSKRRIGQKKSSIGSKHQLLIIGGLSLNEVGAPGSFVTNLSLNLSPNLVTNLVNHQIL